MNILIAATDARLPAVVVIPCECFRNADTFAYSGTSSLTDATAQRAVSSNATKGTAHRRAFTKSTNHGSPGDNPRVLLQIL
jgi:hypothetical protein